MVPSDFLKIHKRTAQACGRGCVRANIAIVYAAWTTFQHVKIINISLIWFHAIIDWFLSTETHHYIHSQ